jgi:hypothetical protein
MECVDFTQVMGQSPDEGAAVQAAKAAFRAQSIEHDGRGRLDELWQAKEVSLSNPYRPDLSSPVVDVSEYGPVHGPQMI